MGRRVTRLVALLAALGASVAGGSAARAAGDEPMTTAAEASVGPNVEAAAVAPARFVPLTTPVRMLDTRVPLGIADRGPLAAGSAVDVAVAGVGGVAAEATSVVLNITVVDVAGPGYVAAYASGTAVPATANVNFDRTGETVATMATAAIGTNGQVRFLASAATDLVVDVAGYYVPSAATRSGRFIAFGPIIDGQVAKFMYERRRLDTRRTGRPAAGSITTVSVLGPPSYPYSGYPSSGVTTVVFNLTAVDPAGPGYVTAFATGTPRPGTSNINLYYDDQIVANQVVVPIGADGTVSLYTSTSVDLVVDMLGYYTDDTMASTTAGLFVATGPSRLFDSRITGRPADDSRFDIAVAGRSGIPGDGAGGVVVTLTIAGNDEKGYVAVGIGRPSAVSSINPDYPDQLLSNQASYGNSTGDVFTGSITSLSLYVYRATDIVVDLAGYFTK